MDRVPVVVLFVLLTIYNTKYAASTVCVDSCSTKSNGNYQACSDCNMYITCFLGYKYSMFCPSNLVWDDTMKRCEWTSSTCPESTTERITIRRTTPNIQRRAICVNSCSGKSDGNYQYCTDCHKYVACSGGYRYIMYCPSDLVWDDNMKRCEWTSSSCQAQTTARTISPGGTAPNI